MLTLQGFCFFLNDMKHQLYKKLIRVEWLPATGGAWRAEQGNLINSVFSSARLCDKTCY